MQPGVEDGKDVVDPGAAGTKRSRDSPNDSAGKGGRKRRGGGDGENLDSRANESEDSPDRRKASPSDGKHSASPHNSTPSSDRGSGTNA